VPEAGIVALNHIADRHQSIGTRRTLADPLPIQLDTPDPIRERVGEVTADAGARAAGDAVTNRNSTYRLGRIGEKTGTKPDTERRPVRSFTYQAVGVGSPRRTPAGFATVRLTQFSTRQIPDDTPWKSMDW